MRFPSLKKTGDAQSTGQSNPPKGRHRKSFIVLALLVVVSMLTAAFIVIKHQKPDYNDVNIVMERVSLHYVLPSDETPALATVTNNQKVQQSFAGKVQNGDKVLIYADSGKAIVYRPSIDRVVDVEPVTIGNTSTDSDSTKIPDINPFGN